jgi:hypothetical protein
VAKVYLNCMKNTHLDPLEESKESKRKQLVEDEGDICFGEREEGEQEGQFAEGRRVTGASTNLDPLFVGH